MPLEFAQGEFQCDYSQGTAVDIALHNYKKQNLPSVEDVLEKLKNSELEKKMSALILEWNPQTPTEKLLVQSLYFAGITNDIRSLKQALQTLLRLKQYRQSTNENSRLSIINKDWT